jgi:hypothetical protein
MGVRLYPILKEGVTLNRVIGVSDADYQRWINFSQELDAIKPRYGEKYDELYQKLYTAEFEGVYRLNSFDLFGWGEFRWLDCMSGYAGELRDIAKVQTLFAINEIGCDISLIEGVYWG